MTKFASRALFALVVLTFSTAASAEPVRWYLQGVTFSDGGRAVGSFVFDSDTGTYTEIDIATTIGTELPGADYGDPNPDSPSDSTGLLSVADDTANPLTGQPLLALGFTQALGNAGGTITIDPAGLSFEGKCGQSGMQECGLVVVARERIEEVLEATQRRVDAEIKKSAALSSGISGVELGKLDKVFDSLGMVEE